MAPTLLFNPATDIPDQSGKVIVITGGTSGLGKQYIMHLAPHNPAHIIFTGRSASRAQEVIAEVAALAPAVNVSFVPLDLGDLVSVKAGTEEILSQVDRLDTLICNAGLLVPPPGVTKQGYELVFGTNHLGHAGLIKGLLSTLLKTADLPSSDVRIVTLTSLGAMGAPAEGVLFDQIKSDMSKTWWIVPQWRRYGQSKISNLVYAKELAERYPKLISTCVHPGVVQTEMVSTSDLAARILIAVTNPRGLLTPEQGAFNTIWAATTVKDRARLSGKWFVPLGMEGTGAEKWTSSDFGPKLWDWTDRALAEYGIN